MCRFQVARHPEPRSRQRPPPQRSARRGRPLPNLPSAVKLTGGRRTLSAGYRTYGRLPGLHRGRLRGLRLVNEGRLSGRAADVTVTHLSLALQSSPRCYFKLTVISFSPHPPPPPRDLIRFHLPSGQLFSIMMNWNSQLFGAPIQIQHFH